MSLPHEVLAARACTQVADGVGRRPEISIVIINKNDAAIERTVPEVVSHARQTQHSFEVVVVDASSGRFDQIRDAHPEVRWIDFDPKGRGISIPAQRNAGVAASRAEIVVFVDVGCSPRHGWLDRLVGPILGRSESICAGPMVAPGTNGEVYALRGDGSADNRYLREAATGNLAFRRSIVDRLGFFDERFDYGSDVDFSWRAIEAGYRIRGVPDAVVEHEWGALRSGVWRSQVKRSYRYGRARARLYGKHRARRRELLKDDPVAVAYPLFLIGLPVALVWPWYPALLLVGVYRNRSHRPLDAVADHLIYGAGVLRELAAR